MLTKKQSVEEEINKIKNDLKNIEDTFKQNESNLKKLDYEKKILEKNIYSLKNKISKGFDESKKQASKYRNLRMN